MPTKRKPKTFDRRKYSVDYAGDAQYQVVDKTQGVALVGPRLDTDYDVAWELADGRIVALEISRGGCVTCGDYGGEQEWYILTPKVPSDD